MLFRFTNLIKSFYRIKIRFDFPQKKKIVIFDETNSLILREILGQEFNILYTRDKEIFFWIIIKQIFVLDFKFLTYCKNYIKFVSPKIVITTIDNNIQFYELKKNFDKINFISIQNGVRFKDWFQDKRISNTKIFTCDHIFVFNKYIIKNFKKFIKSRYHVIGNFKNNIVNIKKTNIRNQFLYISQFDNNGNKEFIKFQQKLLKVINLYISNSKIKIYILLRNKNYFNQEKEFYKKIFHNNCIFYNISKWKKTYETIDKFENIIFCNSTLGYEAIARKKKVAIFSPRKLLGYKYNFGWPVTYKKNYNFFHSNNINFFEIRRVLDNINNCSQSNWQKKYYKEIKDQLFLDKNNQKIKEVISKLLEN